MLACSFTRTVIMGVLLILFLGVISPLVGASSNGKPLVITTTSVARDLTDQIGGKLVNSESIVPPGQCPSHYDVRPSDFQRIGNASLVVYHGMESWLDDLLEATGNSEVKRVQVKGPWKVPDKVLERASTLLEALVDLDSTKGEMYRQNFDELKRKLDLLEGELHNRAELRDVGKLKVISIKWQAAFLRWLGFQVVETYPPPETLSTKRVTELIRFGDKEGVHLVVDNLQSGTKFGAKLASKIGADHIVLTNFPPNEETDSIPALIELNAERMLEASSELERN